MDDKKMEGGDRGRSLSGDGIVNGSEDVVWRKTFDAIFDWICIIDVKTRRILSSNIKCRDFIDLTPEEAIGKVCCEVVHSTINPIDGCPLDSAVLSRKRKEMEFQMDGGSWLHVAIDPIVEENGDVEKVIHIVKDITERKTLEEEYNFINTIFEHSQTANSIADSEGIITHVNESFLKILGFDDRSEVIGKPIAFFFVEEEDVRPIIETLNDTGKWEGRFKARRKDGSTFITEGIATDIRDGNGNIIGYRSTNNDVTETEKAITAMKASEEKYRALFDSSPKGIVILDLDGNILDYNEAQKSLGGIIPREDIIGKPFSELGILSADDVERFLPLFQDLIRGKKIEPVEVKIQNEDKECWLEIHPGFNRKEDEITGIQIITLDITNRKQAEEALIESEERFRGLIEKSYEGILLTDEEGKVIIWNQASEYITGLKQEDVLGKYLCEVQEIFFMKEEDHDIHKEGFCSIVHQVLKTGASPLLNKPSDLEFKRPDGSVRYAQQVFFSSRTKDGYRLGAITQDITERKRSEDIIRANQEKLRSILENSTNLFYSHTTEHMLTYISPQCDQILGYTPDEIMVRWTELVSDHPINEIGFENTLKAIETGMVQPPYELEMVHKSGRKVWVEVREAPLVKDGRTVAIVGALTDITERKRAKDKLVEEKKKAELYLDILGHDINNQNQGILTLLELFLLEYPGDGPGRSDIEQALHQAFSISDLIRNVKTISGIGDARVELEPIDALALIERAIKKVRITYPGKDIILKIKGGEQHPRVMANGLLESLFINILGNAVKFDQKDPVELDLDIRSDDDGSCRFEFSDRGTGVPDSMKEEIFTRLKMGDQSSHGSGLGLAIVSGVTKQYGGRVWVEDRVKGDHTKGARFVLLLEGGST